MNFYKDKIIFTGGSGRFGKIFKSTYSLKNVFYPTKKKLDINNYISKKNSKENKTQNSNTHCWNIETNDHSR